MADHTIRRPTLFISHATSDAEFATAVQQEIEKVFAMGIAVFCTSSPGAIPVGTDWLTDIEQKLGLAQAVIAIVTPVSVERPWLWFEIGATWGKGRAGDCRIYPLCAPEIGAVVETYEPDGLEVEFVTTSGRTQALVTLRLADVRAVMDEDLTSVRPLHRGAA